MAGDHLVRGIDQNRHVEAKALDARGDLADLFLGVRPRIARIGLQLVDCLLRDLETRRRDRRAFRLCGLRLHDVTLQMRRPTRIAGGVKEDGARFGG